MFECGIHLQMEGQQLVMSFGLNGCTIPNQQMQSLKLKLLHLTPTQKMSRMSLNTNDRSSGGLGQAGDMQTSPQVCWAYLVVTTPGNDSEAGEAVTQIAPVTQSD